MSTPPSTAPAELLPVAKGLKTAALNGRIVGEAPLIISCACLAMIFFSAISTQVAADSWLNLLAGREIVHHGLPHHDALAVMSQGREWIDQQWLANVFYYALYAAGGVGFVARANVLLFVVVLALIFIVTRKRGATQLSVMLCCIPACLVGLEFIRAQVLVEPLLVLLIALLSAESRRPSVRVVFAFPMLALWANLHGSVLLAAALVSLLGLVELVQELRLPRRSRRRFVRAAGLFVAPWFFVFVSPYGLGVARYYDTTLRNPMFPRFLTEWAPPNFRSVWGFALLLLAAATIWLVARHARKTTPFEMVALLVTLVGALMALRSIPWFMLTAAVLLPPLLDAERSAGGHPETRTGTRPLAAAGVALSIALAVHGLVRPGNTLAADWPDAAVVKVEGLLAADPSARVLTSYDLADWLLFRSPKVRGRIAFDGRWELLPPSTFRSIELFHTQSTPDWERVSVGYRLLVLNPLTVPGLVRTFENRSGVRILYESRRIVVLDRGPSVRPQP